MVVYVPVTEIGGVRTGDPAEVAVDAFPGRVFPAKVARIGEQAEFTPKNVQTADERARHGDRSRADTGERGRRAAPRHGRRGAVVAGRYSSRRVAVRTATVPTTSPIAARLSAWGQSTSRPAPLSMIARTTTR